MMALDEVKEWLEEVASNCDDPSELGVAVDDGGLCLVIIGRNDQETGEYCEIGGIPEAE